MALSLTYNSYASVDEADYYFEDRMSVSAWTAASSADKAKAIVSATRTIDKENFVGRATSSTQALSFPRTGSFLDPRTGFSIEMDYDYDFVASQPANSAGFPQWFHELPREIRYLKVAVYEQALWFIQNSSVINEYSSTASSSTSGAESTYKIGSIEVTEKGASAAASSSSNRTNPTYYKNLRPILATGGVSGGTWFRSN